MNSTLITNNSDNYVCYNAREHHVTTSGTFEKRLILKYYKSSDFDENPMFANYYL